MTIRPLNDQVIVRLDSTGPRLTEGGVWTPAKGRRVVEADWATVIAAGPGHYPAVRLDPHRPEQPVDLSAVGHTSFIPVHPSIKPGARVLLETAQATDYADPTDPDLRFTREANIIAVAEDE